MKTYKIPHTDLVVSRLAYGCGWLGGGIKAPLTADIIANAGRVINTACNQGITLFDHADVYDSGRAEEVFGAVLKQSPGLRDKIVIQSKCGQRLPGETESSDAFRADLSREHIVSAVEGSLRRLCTDHLDILLLHTSDPLMDPQEVAQAFDELKDSGKVRYFGVSNYNATQIAYLQKYIRQPLVINQIQLGLAHPYPIADGLEFMLEAIEELPKISRGEGKKRFANAYTGLSGAGTLDYCRLHEIQVQAWSPLRGDLLNPSADATPQIRRTAQVLADLASRKNTSPSAVALAWLLRLPAGIVPIIGTSNPDHVIENCAADGVELSREEWYSLFASTSDHPAGGLISQRLIG